MKVRSVETCHEDHSAGYPEYVLDILSDCCSAGGCQTKYGDIREHCSHGTQEFVVWPVVNQTLDSVSL